MDYIETLIDANSTPDDVTAAANNLNRIFDLHFSVDDIIKAFERLYLYVSRNNYSKQFLCDSMFYSLTENVRMFIAIMYTLLDDGDMTPFGVSIYLCGLLVNKGID